MIAESTVAGGVWLLANFVLTVVLVLLMATSTIEFSMITARGQKFEDGARAKSLKSAATWAFIGIPATILFGLVGYTALTIFKASGSTAAISDFVAPIVPLSFITKWWRHHQKGATALVSPAEFAESYQRELLRNVIPAGSASVLTLEQLHAACVAKHEGTPFMRLAKDFSLGKEHPVSVVANNFLHVSVSPGDKVFKKVVRDLCDDGVLVYSNGQYRSKLLPASQPTEVNSPN